MAENKLSAKCVVKRNEDVLFSEVADGMSLMDIDSGKYFHFDQTGSVIWKQIDGDLTISQLCENVQREFDVDAETCAADTIEFLTELNQLKLVSFQS
ncbi:PqqD family protein [Pontixanthobacter gangjinensis]|uniref:PqqD family peptide modification chaperone n=1 Tax=Pontixanthobacter gangjinensis TaxID=1028742 RepID=A0A6I4SP49_9SPHN|nr:PqqD family protein [Pontixanthobacter gangjinensis]MXO57605.1 PqqD family peptide modification chaperone [Pontixanthobacter gangjinensis]